MKIEFDIDQELYNEAITLIAIAVGFIFWGLLNFPLGVGIGILAFTVLSVFEDKILGDKNGSGTKRDQPEGNGRDGTDGSADQRESAEGIVRSVSNNTFQSTGAGPNTDPYIILSRPTDGPGVGTPQE